MTTTLLEKSVDPMSDPGTKAVRSVKDASGGKRFTLFSGVSLALAIIFVLLAMYPIITVLLRLFFTDGKFDPTVFGHVLSLPGLWQMLLNTVVIVIVSGMIAVVCGSVLAWLVVRTNARIKWLGSVLPLLPFVLPALVGTMGWTMLLSPKTGLINILLRGAVNWTGAGLTEGPLDIYSYGGMIFIYTIYMIPFTFLLVSAGLENADSQLEEQSRVSGAGVVRTLFKVTIPSIRPSLGAAMLLTVFFGFAFFAGPAVLSSTSGIDILSVRIANILSFSYPADTGGAVGLSTFMLIAVAIVWWFQTRVLRSSNYSTISGRGKATEIELGRWRWLGRLVIVLYVVISAVLPALALIWVSLRGYWSFDWNFSGLSLTQYTTVLFGDAFSSKALGTSLLLAVIGATIGMIVAAVIARFVRSSPGRSGRVVDVLIKIGAPIPAVVLGVGVLLAFGGAPWRLAGTFGILLLAYLVHFMPQATVNADAAAAQISPQLMEASHISGAGDGRTFLRISLPLMLPDLIAGWSLLFLWMLGEINASIILAGTSNPVLGEQMYLLYFQGYFGKLAALAIVVTIINILVIWAANFVARLLRGGRRVRARTA